MTKAARDKNAQIPLSTKTSLSYIYSAKLGTYDYPKPYIRRFLLALFVIASN